jgi:collagen type VI alpha
LFQGHPRLESYLPGILEDITSIRGVSCGAGAEAQVSLAFKVNSDQEFPAKFQIYQKAAFDSLLHVTVRGPTHLDAPFLQSLWDMFEERSASRGQVYSLPSILHRKPVHLFPVIPQCYVIPFPSLFL